MDGFRIDGRRIGPVAVGGFLLLLTAFWIWWPLGVALGVASGMAVVAAVGRSMQRAADAEPHDDDLDLTGEEELKRDFRRLRVRLGDDWWQFADAAVLVTRSQWASTADLQREMNLSTARARHLLSLLEQEGFVGPTRGTRRREVLVGSESARDLQRLLHA